MLNDWTACHAPPYVIAANVVCFQLVVTSPLTSLVMLLTSLVMLAPPYVTAANAACLRLFLHGNHSSAQAIILTPKTQFLPKYVILKLSFAVYLSPVDDVYTYQDLRTMLVLCEREVGGRTAMQCDRLVMVLPGSLYFCRLQTTLLHIDFAHTPSKPCID